MAGSADDVMPDWGSMQPFGTGAPAAGAADQQMPPDDRLRDAFAQMLMQKQQQGAGPTAAQGLQPLPIEGLWQQQAAQQMPTNFQPPPITSVEPGPNKGMALPMPQVMDNPGNNQDFPMPPAYTPSSPKPVPARLRSPACTR